MTMFRLRQLLLLACSALALVAACCVGTAFGAGSGGATLPDPTVTSSNTGGSPADNPAAAQINKKIKEKAERRRTPFLTRFRIHPTSIVDGGHPLVLRYRVKATAKKVRVRLVVRTAQDEFVKTLELGVHRTRVNQRTSLTQGELGISRGGSYRMRLTARDGKGRKALHAAKVPTWLDFTFSDHRFPVAGRFSFGSDGAKFGAGRPGHIHQGQDVVADSGVPLVAPYRGKITWVDYQAGGAGYYVVLDAADGRDYVLMHLLKGSTLVKAGQTVRTGERLGLVGATGDASGPHLHFEVWVDGPWQFGGHPVDPLPLLQSWYASGPGGAVRTSALAGAGVDYPLD